MDTNQLFAICHTHIPDVTRPHIHSIDCLMTDPETVEYRTRNSELQVEYWERCFGLHFQMVSWLTLHLSVIA